MMTVDVRSGDRTERHTDLNAVKELIDDPNSLFWIDITDPTDSEWDELVSKFNFHPLAIEDARKQNQRPKVEEYEGHLFLALRAWRGEQSPSDDIGDATQ